MVADAALIEIFATNDARVFLNKNFSSLPESRFFAIQQVER